MSNATAIKVTNPQVKVGRRGAAAAQKLRTAAKLQIEVNRLKDEAKAELAEIMPCDFGTEGVFNGQVVVKVGRNTSTRTDYDTLLKAFPEAYAAVVEKTPITFFKV